MEKDATVFFKEYEILNHAERLLNQPDANREELLEQYKIIFKKYKQLIRRFEMLTRISDAQQRRLNNILERLSRFVSFQLFTKITKGKEKVEIKTQRKKLSVFFSDLKDFTLISSHMEGESLSEFLNSYLEAMTQIVLKWGGTLDKYMGDAIMVFFGDPEFTTDQDHAERCVIMAIEMREKMKDLRKQWYELGYQEPLHTRMGIATGYCTVGNFGSSERMDYTILGAAVNLASRLENAADVDEILISHETWGYVKEKVSCEPPIALSLKGFHQIIHAHKVVHIRELAVKHLMFTFQDDIKGININIDLDKTSNHDLQYIIDELEKKLKPIDN